MLRWCGSRNVEGPIWLRRNSDDRNAGTKADRIGRAFKLPSRPCKAATQCPAKWYSPWRSNRHKGSDALPNPGGAYRGPSTTPSQRRLWAQSILTWPLAGARKKLRDSTECLPQTSGTATLHRLRVNSSVAFVCRRTVIVVRGNSCIRASHPGPGDNPCKRPSKCRALFRGHHVLRQHRGNPGTSRRLFRCARGD